MLSSPGVVALEVTNYLACLVSQAPARRTHFEYRIYRLLGRIRNWVGATIHRVIDRWEDPSCGFVWGKPSEWNRANGSKRFTDNRRRSRHRAIENDAIGFCVVRASRGHPDICSLRRLIATK